VPRPRLRVDGLSLPKLAHRAPREATNPGALAIDQSAQNAQALDHGQQHPRRTRDPAFGGNWSATLSGADAVSYSVVVFLQTEHTGSADRCGLCAPINGAPLRFVGPIFVTAPRGMEK